MLKVIEKEMGNIILLMIVPVFGMSVEKQCKEFMYPHPHNELCLSCRICPDWVVANEDVFRQHREALCGNAALQDGRKVQCANRDYDRPTCPTLTPRIGNIECEDNSTVHTSCRLTCPKGYFITNELNLTCLPLPHLHWDHQLPVCQASSSSYKDSDFSEKHAHKDLGLFVIFSICLLFLFCPCLVLIFLIQWKKRENRIQQQSKQEVPQMVKIHLKNANRSQRCYVLKNSWVAKIGEDVTVTADAKFVQIKHLIVIKDERMTDPPVYSALLTAPNEIVLHSVTSRHKGWYSWTAHLRDNSTESGRFHLDVRHIIPDRLTYSRSNSREAGYEELQEEEDTQQLIEVVGFDSLLKNMKDMKRLSVLFDQDRQQGLVTWHVIATSPLIMYDIQQVQNEEYRIRSKSTFSPTFNMIHILHQRGKSVKDLRDFLLTHLSSTAEAIQILDKYL